MPSFRQFSSGGQSSHLHTPEATPLRKRENDSFASPEAPLLWRQSLQPATGGLHNTSTSYSPSMAASSSHFADVNFVHSSRRRGRYDNRQGAQFWVPWVMRGILASPLIVVMMWLAFVAIRHPREAQTVKNNNSYGMPRVLQQKHPENKILHPFLASHHQKNSANDHPIPVYVPMGASQNDQQLQQEFTQMVQNSGLQQPPQYMIPMSQAHKTLMKESQSTQQQQFQQYSQQGQLQMNIPMQQAQPQIMAGQNMMQLTQQQPGHGWNNLRGGGKKHAKPHKLQQQDVPPQSAAQPKIFYYEPNQAIVQGQLQAPTVVYDEHGNEIELASLVTGVTELFIEPPLLADLPMFGASQPINGNRRMMAASNSTNSTLPHLLGPPPLEMKIKTPESWGQSTSQDQSIIVCTVAVMALLVGALSARRLRARSYLSSCIENESLEDDVAFDSAYTVTGGDSYNTFGWKGDLEKFDV
ncbi:expressed unknown protein [Seminavis robusta]|uniref:Uncharacterized protein n=1 Tax=Seminavis robusta TaxID=568900 RepID=A0A9N8DY64_9STRA|nr:expressed unknown protein [Seminavis robusta]|eukprot:Sro335_g120060.1 n/a (469) ;mRNA; f:34010-35743